LCLAFSSGPSKIHRVGLKAETEFMAIFDNILITGGGGMLAYAFKDVLGRQGVTPTLLPRAEFDITDPLSVVFTFDKVSPTLVINCAAYTKVDQAEKDRDAADAINGKGVGHLAEACRRRSVPLVHFSTDYVFDGSLRRPLKPDDPVGPKSYYGISKLLGERMLQEFAPTRWLILRTAWLYGPGGPNFPQTMLNAARAGKALKVINDQFGCPTFTFDLAQATLSLLKENSHGIYHLSNAGETSWFEFAGAIMNEFGVKPASLDPISSAAWTAIKPDSAVRPAYSVLDTTPYSQKTGKVMPDWRDALHRYRILTSA
jgi:dTDP-4-dehydrorhamnose reductase